MRSKFYDRTGKPIEAPEWNQKREDKDYRVVVQTPLADGRLISTVWLGEDQAWAWGPFPMIFETMVLGTKKGQGHHQRRYSTEDEARAGHWALLEELEGR